MSFSKEAIEELKQVAQDTYDSKNEDDDAYDELISNIILIEKSHKFSSSGEENKLNQINKEIERFLEDSES